MDKQPLVSIIIASYNYGFTIAETITSLQRQSILDWEAIIVDDGSTDNTAKIVRQFAATDARIIFIKQDNAGVSAARNTAMKIARGTYIQYLDADDLLSPQKLELHSQFLIINPAEDLVFSNVRYFKHGQPDELLYAMGDNKGDAPLAYETLSAEQAVSKMFVHNIVPICAPLFRREVMEKVGLYDSLLTSLEDWEYWFRVAIHGYKFTYLDDDRALAFIRVHRKSLSWNWDRMVANRMRVKNNMNNYIKALIHNTERRLYLLNASEKSMLEYYGYAVFMNIKFFDLKWGLRKALSWAVEHKRYKYFIGGALISTKVRFELKYFKKNDN